MAIPTTQSGTDKVITYIQAVIDTTYYLPVPANGRVKEFSACLGAALTSADETYTLSYAPPGSVTYTAVTGGAITFTSSGSAAGNVETSTVAPSTTAYVVKGGSLKVVASGGGATAVPIGVTIRIGN